MYGPTARTKFAANSPPQDISTGSTPNVPKMAQANVSQKLGSVVLVVKSMLRAESATCYVSGFRTVKISSE